LHGVGLGLFSVTDTNLYKVSVTDWKKDVGKLGRQLQKEKLE
jgi:hypothetical protein